MFLTHTIEYHCVPCTHLSMVYIHSVLKLEGSVIVRILSLPSCVCVCGVCVCVCVCV